MVRWLHDFIRILPAGGRVLELGCGSGRDAEILFAHGFEVDPTDGTPAMAAQAAKRLGRPVKVMRFDELAEIGVYGGVWAHASLLHVPRSALATILSLVFPALKPDGMFFANYNTGDTEGRDQLDRYYNYPDRQMLLETYLSSAPWEILSAVDYVGGSYGGGKTPWIAIIAKALKIAKRTDRALPNSAVAAGQFCGLAKCSTQGLTKRPIRTGSLAFVAACCQSMPDIYGYVDSITVSRPSWMCSG